MPLESVADRRCLLARSAQLAKLVRGSAFRRQPDRVRDPLVAGSSGGGKAEIAPNVEVARRLHREALDLDPEQRGSNLLGVQLSLGRYRSC